MQDLVRVSQTLYRWIRLGQIGVKMEDLLADRGYSRIVVYGFTDLARCLVYELDKGPVRILGIIDRQGKNLQIDMLSVSIDSLRKMDIDAVINCYLDDGRIAEQLKQYCDCEVISIEELVYEL